MLRFFQSSFMERGLLMSITLLHFIPIHECSDLTEDKMSKEISPVELMAVLINCELDVAHDTPDNEATRFEREELFKHNALRDCNKKLALTLKICSEPIGSGDEFVPVDHVLQGPGRKRVRLLAPYVLRLRRDALLQAYKLRLVDTVRGILTTSNELNNDEVQDLDAHFKKHVATLRDSRLNRAPEVGGAADELLDCETDHVINARDHKHTKRIKREEHEQNVVIERVSNEKMPQDETYSLYLKNKIHNKDETFFDRPVKTHNAITDEKSYETSESYQLKGKQRHIFSFGKAKDPSKSNIRHHHLNANGQHIVRYPTAKHASEDIIKDKVIHGSERDFALYEIGSPDLWFKIHIQLFEKFSTDKGNTLWNDVTKGEFASVSSLRPQWSGRDVAVAAQYRAADAAARAEFALPGAGLCLLAPLDPHDSASTDDFPPANDLDYIVVPSEDVISVENFHKEKNSLANVSDEDTKGRHKRVVVHVDRALWNVMEDNISIASDGAEKYLTMIHRRPHCAQVDLEVRADDNQLVRVGSSGRIAIVVADSTRRARSTITVQATNTGLAMARFRAQIRECDSGLLNLMKLNGEGGPTAGAVLVPPRHTRRVLLELPVELPADLQHCSVSLVNDDDESVAVRDVVLKRGDRCFCVWHCDCVCFEENPTLSCREMSPARQAAAGLAVRGGRRARSACYCDQVPLDVAVTVVGVILLLLLLGLLKGVVGLLFPRVSLWGLDLILQTPRTLDHYYESSLRVHPDTGERSVLVVSRLTSLILNIFFFVVTPSLLLLALVKRIVKGKHCVPTGRRKSEGSRSNTQDTQSQKSHRHRRRRRHGLRHWMTPHADQLTRLWQKDIDISSSQCNYARPLLTGACAGPMAAAGPGAGAVAGARESASDSEQDDTAFVLMHMRKSAESISKTQRTPNMSAISNHSTTSH